MSLMWSMSKVRCWPRVGKCEECHANAVLCSSRFIIPVSTEDSQLEQMCELQERKIKERKGHFQIQPSQLCCDVEDWRMHIRNFNCSHPPPISSFFTGRCSKHKAQRRGNEGEGETNNSNLEYVSLSFQLRSRGRLFQKLLIHRKECSVFLLDSICRLTSAISLCTSAASTLSITANLFAISFRRSSIKSLAANVLLIRAGVTGVESVRRGTSIRLTVCNCSFWNLFRTVLFNIEVHPEYQNTNKALRNSMNVYTHKGPECAVLGVIVSARFAAYATVGVIADARNIVASLNVFVFFIKYFVFSLNIFRSYTFLLCPRSFHTADIYKGASPAGTTDRLACSLKNISSLMREWNWGFEIGKKGTFAVSHCSVLSVDRTGYGLMIDRWARRAEYGTTLALHRSGTDNIRVIHGRANINSPSIFHSFPAFRTSKLPKRNGGFFDESTVDLCRFGRE